ESRAEAGRGVVGVAKRPASAHWRTTAIQLPRVQIETERFLRTTPAKKPRTECCCQWVVRMMAAIRCSLRPAQQREHASLFGARPAVARRAGFSLRLARRLLLASLPVCRNGTPLTGGDDLRCGCFDFAKMHVQGGCDDGVFQGGE